MTKENNNPWAGLASYEDPAKSERKLKFCGRDNDIYDVTRLIDDNLLLILYGKSGIGKTSLLNAGVFPKLRLEQYLPVSIRLGTLEANASYQEAIISAIEKAIEDVGGSKITYSVVEEQTDNYQSDRLWNYFARHRFANAEGQSLFPVVVLDQFEEVLRNISPEHIGKAQTMLNQLQYLIDENHALSDCIVDGKEYFYDFNFRFVISIREDELYLLEDNIDDLSLSMFRNCRYRLRSLSVQGATEAILVPGKDCIADEEKQTIVDRVIELSKRPQSNDIDTLLLSLVCAGTYDKKAGYKITFSDLAVWKSNPMEVYYQDAVKGLSANQVRYIQQHLIREDGSRKRVNANEVKATLGESTYHTLTQGENRMFVLGEHEQVELLHDQLALAVYEERKAFEERERKKRLRRRVSFVSVILLAIAGIFIFQNHRLKQQRWKIMESQARFVATKALDLIEKGDAYTASILSISVLPSNLDNPEKPYTPEAEYALRMSLKHQSVIMYGHREEINSVMYSPTGKEVVSASNDGSIIIWDANTGNMKHELKGHEGCVNFASYNPQSNRIVSGSNDGTIRVWDAVIGKEILKINVEEWIKTAVYSPDGSRIATVAQGTIQLWDSEDGTEILTIPVHLPEEIVFNGEKSLCFNVDKMQINTVFFSPNGKRLVSASNDETVRIWDANTGKELNRLIGHNEQVKSASFNPNGLTIISVSWFDVFLWDVQTGEPLLSVNKPYPIRSASFSNDGKHIIISSDNDSIYILNANTLVEEHCYKAHTDVVSYASFSPDNHFYASASWDKTVKICRIDNITNEILQIQTKPKGWHFSAQYSLDCDNIITYDPITIWNAQTGVLLDSVKNYDGGTIFAIYDMEDVLNTDTIPFIIDNENKKEIKDIESYKGNQLRFNCFDETNYGKYQLKISQDDYSILICDKESGMIIEKNTGLTNKISNASFSSDGQRIMSASIDGKVLIWDFPPLQELIDQTRERFKNRKLTDEERRMYYLE